jgi:hypothetical protein
VHISPSYAESPVATLDTNDIHPIATNPKYTHILLDSLTESLLPHTTLPTLTHPPSALSVVIEGVAHCSVSCRNVEE